MKKLNFLSGIALAFCASQVLFADDIENSSISHLSVGTKIIFTKDLNVMANSTETKLGFIKSGQSFYDCNMKTNSSPRSRVIRAGRQFEVTSASVHYARVGIDHENIETIYCQVGDITIAEFRDAIEGYAKIQIPEPEDFRAIDSQAIEF